MNLRDALDVKVGSTPVNKIYKGIYKVWDRNKIALEGYCIQNGTPSPDNEVPIEVMQGRQVVNIKSRNLIGIGTQLNGFRNLDTNRFNSNANSVGYYFSTELLPDTITFNCVGGNRANISYYNEIPAQGVESLQYSNSNIVPRTITVDKNYKYIHIQLSYNILDISKIQLEEGTEATPWVPYKNEQYTVDLKSKNVFDINDIDNGYFTNNDGNLNTAIEGFHSNRYIDVDNDTIYIRLKGLDNIQLGRFWIQEYDENKNSIVRHTIGIYDTFFEKEQVLKYTLQLNLNTKYIRISSYSLKVLEGEEYILKKPIKDYFTEYLECTVSFTDLDTYEPYYDYKLAGIGDYKDNFYTDKGKWYLHKEIEKDILDGTEYWTNHPYGTNSYEYAKQNMKSIENLATIKSNYFKGIAFVDRATGSNIIYVTSQISIVIRNTQFTTVENFKTWLSTHNVETYYILQTPTVEEITAPTLINQLNALYQAM